MPTRSAQALEKTELGSRLLNLDGLVYIDLNFRSALRGQFMVLPPPGTARTLLQLTSWHFFHQLGFCHLLTGQKSFMPALAGTC